MTNGTLYVVAAPIGNAGDITERAKKVLAEVDIIAAEDTRSAGILLKAININNKLISYHKFNEKQREEYLISLLESGHDAAIISDAGTPCISDPGGLIVKAAVDCGIRVTTVCGASAVTAALSICGFRFDTFTFYGFLPRTNNHLRKLIKATSMNKFRVINREGNVDGDGDGDGDGCVGVDGDERRDRVDVGVFFESPKRIKNSMAVFEAEAPSVSICLCNDLTKTYEKIYRGTPRQVLDELIANPSAEKGEYTLVVAFPLKADIADAVKLPLPLSLSPEAAIVDHLIKQNGSIKDAVSILSHNRLYKRNELYEAANNLKKILRTWEENGRHD